jgi:hypothetical protein
MNKNIFAWRCIRKFKKAPFAGSRRFCLSFPVAGLPRRKGLAIEIKVPGAERCVLRLKDILGDNAFPRRNH